MILWDRYIIIYLIYYICILYIYNIYMYTLLFSCQIVSDSSWLHGLQFASPPYPPPSPRACPSSCPLNSWWHSTISSSVALSSFCLQYIWCKKSCLFKLKWLIAGNLNLGGRLLVAVLSLCAMLPPQVIDVHSMPLQLERVCCTHACFCSHQLACTKYQLFPNLDLKIGFVTIVTFLTT